MTILKQRNVIKLLSILALFIFLQSCATYRIQKAQRSVRQSFAAGDYEKTVELLNHFGNNKTYKKKDKVLFLLEKGTAYHFAGQYDSSFTAYENAEKEIQRLFSKSISRGIASFMVNDNILAYNGEDYENIYLNTFKSLNFIHQNNLGKALVEAKRMAYKLQSLNIKYQGLVRALSKADTTNQVSWRSGKTNIQNSALGHFLSGIIYAKSNHPDDARIEYEQMLKAFTDQSVLYPNILLANNPLASMKRSDAYNTALISFTGRAPVKYEVNTRIYLAQEDFYLKLALPVLKIIPSEVYSVQAVLDDTLHMPLYMIENMDQVAAEVYKVKEPIIYARSFVRAFLKASGTVYAKNKLRKEGKRILSGLVNLFGKIATESTEKADLRSWQTMPGQVYANLLQLSPGTHKLHIEYYSYNGRLLFEDHKEITISEHNTLELAESLYWN
ncbi:MAG TPA: hypothetical protein VKA34_08940 [Balneolales bacterium]|nr:hypothetical protein [Balneolales bacterium]